MSSSGETQKLKTPRTKTSPKNGEKSDSEEDKPVTIRAPRKQIEKESEDSTQVTKEKPEKELPAEKKRDGPNYKDLWESAFKKGLIVDELKESKPFYRFIVNYKTIQEKLDEYEAADNEEKTALTAAFTTFFENRKKENHKAWQEKKNSRKKEKGSQKKSSKKEKSTNKKGTSKKSGEKKGTHKKGTHKKGTKSNSRSLKELWQKCMESGLIDEDYSFHRGIPDFITLSELRVIKSRYKNTKKQEDIKRNLNDDIKSFNEMSHPVERFFKVYRTYEVLWEEATTLKLIPKNVKYNEKFSVFVTPKILVAYMETIVHNKDLVKPLQSSIMEMIDRADDHIKRTDKYKDATVQDLIKSATRQGFVDGKNACLENEDCVESIDDDDFRNAYFAFLKLPEEEAEKRKARWAAYMKTLSLSK